MVALAERTAVLGCATKGNVNAGALIDLERRFQPFGMAKTLSSDLANAATTLPQINGDLNALVTGPVSDYRVFVQIACRDRAG
jgi:hypothetical protein